jgi:histidinol dehydrogenase
MPKRLNVSDADFAADFQALLSESREEKVDVDGVVADILTDVRVRGDEALIDYTQKFDRLDLRTVGLRVPEEEIATAKSQCSPDLLTAMKSAADRIRDYHTRQMPEDLTYTSGGTTLGYRWTAVQAAGLYVPGGTAPLFSSVLMNAIPAQVAGVERLVVTMPMPEGASSPAMLAACDIASVTEVYRVGGAQAIAALAFGTESISPVDVVVGPGNAYVASAKKQVFGIVGIDMVAGPSEVTVVADAGNDPSWIAADLLAQAEHDASSQSILITDSAEFADDVAKAVESQLATLERKDIARSSWEAHGAIILAAMERVPELVDRIAPEHLELAVENPDDLASKIRNAGAIFLGRHTPEALGDYIAGPSHVLPTSGTARFSSGLSVMDFLKRTSLIGCDADALRALGPGALKMAEAENLSAHARSISIRMNLE